MTNGGSDSGGTAGADQAPHLTFIVLPYNHGLFPNLQVVVADDASNRLTSEIIADYARNHPRPVVATLNSRTLGITRNSKVELRACRSDFIAFMRGDDVLLPVTISARAALFR